MRLERQPFWPPERRARRRRRVPQGGRPRPPEDKAFRNRTPLLTVKSRRDFTMSGVGPGPESVPMDSVGGKGGFKMVF